jgi:hypothetical protein
MTIIQRNMHKFKFLLVAHHTVKLQSYRLLWNKSKNGGGSSKGHRQVQINAVPHFSHSELHMDMKNFVYVATLFLIFTSVNGW